MSQERCRVCRIRPARPKNLIGWCDACRRSFNAAAGREESFSAILSWALDRVWHFAEKQAAPPLGMSEEALLRRARIALRPEPATHPYAKSHNVGAREALHAVADALGTTAAERKALRKVVDAPKQIRGASGPPFGVSDGEAREAERRSIERETPLIRLGRPRHMAIVGSGTRCGIPEPQARALLLTFHDSQVDCLRCLRSMEKDGKA